MSATLSDRKLSTALSLTVAYLSFYSPEPVYRDTRVNFGCYKAGNDARLLMIGLQSSRSYTRNRQTRMHILRVPAYAVRRNCRWHELQGHDELRKRVDGSTVSLQGKFMVTCRARMVEPFVG